jgi:hypothetical protein
VVAKADLSLPLWPTMMTDLYRVAAQLPSDLAGTRRSAGYGDLLAAGASRGALRWAEHRGRINHPHRDVYIGGTGQPDLLDRLHSLAARLPDGAAVGGRTAALLYGFGVLPDARIHIVIPRGQAIPQIGGIAAHESFLPFEPTLVLGVACVPADRCAVDLTRTVARHDALAVLDAALFSGACTPTGLAAEVERHDGLRGVRQARALVPLADPRPECRQESQLRLLLHDAGFPTPVPQLPIIDDMGRAIYKLDLAFEAEMVGVEYDGRSHADRQRLGPDRDRHNWLDLHQWKMRYATDQDLGRGSYGFLTNLRATLTARRSFTPIKDLWL